MSIKPSRHRARKLRQQSIQLVNEAVLSSVPSDKFPTLQAQEDCSLTIELELLNLTGTRWASHACTLLPMLELFEQLKSHGTSQMTWHHLKCRLIWWPQPGTISARDSTSDAFNFCISRSGCGRYIATQWFWAALHLINLPPMSKWRPNATNLVCSGYRTSAFATTWRMLRTRCPSMRECLHRGCVPILHACIPWPHRADVPPKLFLWIWLCSPRLHWYISGAGKIIISIVTFPYIYESCILHGQQALLSSSACVFRVFEGIQCKLS